MIRFWVFVLVMCVAPVRDVLGDYPFEKIFTAKNQRYQIDKLRLQNKEIENPLNVADENSAIEQLGKTHQVRFSGYLTRQDGTEVYWLDGRTELGEFAQDVKVKKDTTNKSFIIHTSDAQASLRPGQVWLVDKEQVIENYELINEVSVDESLVDDTAKK